MTPLSVATEKPGFRISGEGFLPASPERRPVLFRVPRAAAMLALLAAVAVTALVATEKGSEHETVPLSIAVPRGEVRIIDAPEPQGPVR